MVTMNRALGAIVLAAALGVAPPSRAEPPSVKLGVLTDLTGIYSDLTGTGTVEAVRMAVEDCLAAECKGMHIDTVVADHQNKPDTALTIARQWVDRENVDVFIDMSNAAIQIAMAPFAVEKHKVVIYAGGTARITGDACQPSNVVQWMWDTYVQVAGVARPLTKPGTKWFLIAADYELGKQFEADTRTIVGAAGGTLIGVVKHPFPSNDLSAFMLQAQSSGADIVALGNAGADTINAVKAAAEFGVGRPGSGQQLVAYFLGVTDVKSIGLPIAGGTLLSEGFYWDLDAGTRRFSERFMAGHKAMPSQAQAGLYSATLHYLKSVAAEGSTNAEAVVRRMHQLPVHDDVVRNATLRPDGRLVHDWYLFQVKQPSESKGPWDFYKLLNTVPGDQAFRSLAAGGCPRLLTN